LTDSQERAFQTLVSTDVDGFKAYFYLARTGSHVLVAESHYPIFLTARNTLNFVSFPLTPVDHGSDLL
jgi:hypothetical protein